MVKGERDKSDIVKVCRPGPSQFNTSIQHAGPEELPARLHQTSAAGENEAEKRIKSWSRVVQQRDGSQ